MQTALRRYVFALAVTVAVGYVLVNPEEPDNGIAHNRTLRHTECYEDEYPLTGKCCRHCPAGTRVSEHCAVNHARGTCQPCTLGKDYTAAPNGMVHCLTCDMCRKDQVLVKECTQKTNAECQCRPGFYCLPEEPCEACSPCSSCPEGQRIREDCTAIKDTVCEAVPRTETTFAKGYESTRPLAPPGSLDPEAGTQADLDTRDPKTGSGRDRYLEFEVGIGTAAICVFLLVFLAFVLYRSRWCRERRLHNGSKSSLVYQSADPSANSSLRSTPQLERNRTGEQDPEEVAPLAHGHEPVQTETVTAQTAESTTPGTASNPGGYKDPEPVGDHVDFEDEKCEESEQGVRLCRECGQTPFCDCQWTDFMYTVNDNVRTGDFVRLMRQLRLNENKIQQVIMDNPKNSAEQNYKLLDCWRIQNGKHANMETVLRVLNNMGLGGCCENIVNCLSKEIPISSSWKNC